MAHGSQNRDAVILGMSKKPLGWPTLCVSIPTNLRDSRTMTIAKDLDRLALQEKRLQFDAFDQATAWELGSLIKRNCESAGVGDLQRSDRPAAGNARRG